MHYSTNRRLERELLELAEQPALELSDEIALHRGLVMKATGHRQDLLLTALFELYRLRCQLLTEAEA